MPVRSGKIESVYVPKLKQKRLRWRPEKCLPLVILYLLLIGVISGLAVAPVVIWLFG